MLEQCPAQPVHEISAPVENVERFYWKTRASEPLPCQKPALLFLRSPVLTAQPSLGAWTRMGTLLSAPGRIASIFSAFCVQCRFVAKKALPTALGVRTSTALSPQHITAQWIWSTICSFPAWGRSAAFRSSRAHVSATSLRTCYCCRQAAGRISARMQCCSSFYSKSCSAYHDATKAPILVHQQRVSQVSCLTRLI